jgi:hypothetical protein
MKFNCGLPRDERRALAWESERNRLEQWHPFFCLLPRRLGGSTTCVWLEWIRRKGHYEDGYNGRGWVFEYRPALNDSLP